MNPHHLCWHDQHGSTRRAMMSGPAADRSARFLASLDPSDIKALLDGDPRLPSVLAMADAARKAVAEEAAEAAP